MGTLHGYPIAIGELIRSTAIEGRTVDVRLDHMPTQNARGIAHFSVSVGLPWVTEHRVVLITPRGELLRHTVKKAVEWLTENMPGAACTLALTVPDASGFSRQWTEPRMAGRAQRMAALNPDASMGAAVARAALAQGDAATMDSVRAMGEAAAIIIAMRTAGAWPEPYVAQPPWVAAAGEPGNRAVPAHTDGLDGVEDGPQWYMPIDTATHALAARVRDDRGREFWGIGAPARATKASNAQVQEWLAGPFAEYDLPYASVAKPDYWMIDYKSQIVERIAVIRLSDGAVMDRVDMLADAGGEMVFEPRTLGGENARYMALSPEGDVLGFSESAAGAEAAARACIGWQKNVAFGNDPLPNGPQQWVLCDLVQDTEEARIVVLDGEEVIGRIDDPMPVR